MAERKTQFRTDGIMHATINGHRFHLRLTDPTEENFLWIDGQQPPIVLDQVAADFIGHMIEAMWKYQSGEGNESERVIDYVVGKMFSQYGRRVAIPKRMVTKNRLRADLDRIFGTLMAIAEGACPADMTMGQKEIQYAEWNGPARMDLALTYKCNLNCAKCYVGEKGNTQELDTKDWLKVYEILWELGIPQVVFTGGEPTLRDDLVRLVSEADEFVTGLVTNGTQLEELAKYLRNASLDYVQVTIESFNHETHDAMTCTKGSHGRTVKGISEALQVGMQVVTNTTLTKTNAQEFSKTIRFLNGLGIRSVACNTLICSGRGTAHRQQNGLSDGEIANILHDACQVADSLGMDFQWYSPTCYTLGVNPIDLGLGVKACSAAAHNMTIQPDGTVLPCQSWPETVGNILNDKWDAIWKHPTCMKLRQNAMKADECFGCKFEETCGGGCPLEKSERKKS